MKNLKKITSLALVVLMTAVLFAGCGTANPSASTNSGAANAETQSGASGTGDTGNKQVVRMVVPGLSEKATTDPISGITSGSIQDFENFLNEQITDVTIKVSSIPWDGWIQKIEVMATSGEMDVGFYTNQVAVPDWYIDLTPYLEKDPDVNFNTLNDLFVEPAVYYTKYKSFNYPEATDQVFGIPMTMACNLFAYDKQLFEEWGVEPPNENTTMSELVAMAEKMTGINPVTGKQNYGAYLRDYWFEWVSVSYDAVKPMESADMLISNIDTAKYVDYIKDSPEALTFFTDLGRLVACAPEGIATNTGAEKFYTPDNDIAINFDTNGVTATLMKYVFAEHKETTDRFIPIVIPEGKNGKQGFPEFFRFSVSKQANDPDAAWNVVKQLTTNKTIVDYYLRNYATDKISSLKDTSGMRLMDYDIVKERYTHQSETVFLTYDYWTWRTPLQEVIKKTIAKEVTPDQARVAFYEGVKGWVDNTRAQLGQ